MKEQRDFLIGPAVDEAAENSELSQGPFLWLAPSALELVERDGDTFSDDPVPHLVAPYSVPLKQGKVARTYAFNYFTGPNASSARRTETETRLLASFGPGRLKPDVAAKKTRTVTFLRKLRRFYESGEWMTYLRPTRIAELEDLPRCTAFVGCRRKILRSNTAAAVKEHRAADT